MLELKKIHIKQMDIELVMFLKTGFITQIFYDSAVCGFSLGGK
jgi:hypothetical protein